MTQEHSTIISVTVQVSTVLHTDSETREEVLVCHWWERVTNECAYCLQYARTYVPAYSAVSMYFTRCEYKLCVEGIRGAYGKNGRLWRSPLSVCSIQIHLQWPLLWSHQSSVPNHVIHLEACPSPQWIECLCFAICPHACSS